MYYSSKRQAFLVDQGYAFKVITRLEGIENYPDLAFSTPQDRRELLMDVILAKEEDAKTENIQGDSFGSNYASTMGRKKKGAVRRTAGALSEYSGGQDMAYLEANRSRNKELKGVKGVKNSFLKGLARSSGKK
jgi:DNA excision repair protein ERCC-3